MGGLQSVPLLFDFHLTSRKCGAGLSSGNDSLSLTAQLNIARSAQKVRQDERRETRYQAAGNQQTSSLQLATRIEKQEARQSIREKYVAYPDEHRVEEPEHTEP
jgi:hypothetical protein